MDGATLGVVLFILAVLAATVLGLMAAGELRVAADWPALVAGGVVVGLLAWGLRR